MEEICKEILEKVGEYNEREEPIYSEKMVPMFKGRISRTTVYKRIRHLVEIGVLEERMVMSKHGSNKCLYIPSQDELTIQDMMAEMHTDIKRIVAFFESFHPNDDKKKRDR